MSKAMIERIGLIYAETSDHYSRYSESGFSEISEAAKPPSAKLPKRRSSLSKDKDLPIISRPNHISNLSSAKMIEV